MPEHGQAHASRRLIEEDKPRTGHEGHRGVEKLLLAVTQRTGLLVRKMRQTKELDDPRGGLAEAGIGAPEQGAMPSNPDVPAPQG